MAEKYPYQYVTGSVHTAMGQTGRNLEKVGATDVFMNHSLPEVFFRLNEKPFAIRVPIGVFMRLNGGDKKKAIKQGWSALRDYVKALVILAKCSVGEDEAWRVLAPHLLLADGKSTAADLIAASAERGKLRLALPASSGDIDLGEME
ncbi:MAG: hypothetical protein JRG73_21085 [Deltaproteobacteria bacterium]|nr:hypothetical protein [Deltaproteobacteria bacterium]